MPLWLVDINVGGYAIVYRSGPVLNVIKCFRGGKHERWKFCQTSKFQKLFYNWLNLREEQLMIAYWSNFDSKDKNAINEPF